MAVNAKQYFGLFLVVGTMIMIIASVVTLHWFVFHIDVSKDTSLDFSAGLKEFQATLTQKGVSATKSGKLKDLQADCEENCFADGLDYGGTIVIVCASISLLLMVVGFICIILNFFFQKRTSFFCIWDHRIYY